MKNFLGYNNVNNITLIFLSILISALSNWAQLSFLTKQTDLFLLGVFTLSLAVSNPLFQLLNLQLRPIYVSDRKRTFSFNHYFSLRITTSLLCILIGIVISCFIFKEILTINIFIFVFILYAIDAMIDIFNAELHYDERLIAVSISTIIRSVFGFVGVFIGVFFYKNLLTGIILGCALKIVGFFFYDYKLIKESKASYKFIIDAKTIQLIKKSLPLGIGLLIGSLNINICKYFVNYSYGVETQGIYSTLSYIIVLGNMFIGTFGQILLPKMAIYYNNGNISKFYTFHKLFLLFAFFVGISLWILTYFFKDIFIYYFFSKNIVDYSNLLIWIMGSAISIYLASAVGYSLIALDVIIEQAILGLICLFVNISLNLLFLNRVSLEMISVFTGIVFFVQFLIGFFIVIRKIS